MRHLVAIALCVVPAFAQLNSYTVQVTASSTASPQTDEVSISVTVTAPLSTDVLALVKNAGITLADLNFTYATSLNSGPGMAWNFNLTVPVANLSDTLNQLANLQRTVALPMKGTSLSFSITGLQTSAQLQASQPCPFADLVMKARAEAQKLAQAAGFTLGQVSALSASPSNSLTSGSGEAAYYFGVSNDITARPVTILASVVNINPFARTPLVNSGCTVTVQFKVTTAAAR